MNARLVLADPDLRCGRWEAVLADVECDALVVDAPYSANTHDGHFSGTRDRAKPDAEWLARRGYDDKVTLRKPLMFPCWSPEDVREFVTSWAPRTRGWMISITDDVLGHVWQDAMRDAGRYAFAPLPLVELGKQPRLTGDGPASWTCWIMVSRPATREFASWGSLPGAYVTMNKDRNRIAGGKSMMMMRRIIRDYSRPGDLVCDPCAGGATTLVAARLEGRNAVGSEMDEATFAIASKRLAKPWTPDMFASVPAESLRVAAGRLV